MNDMLARCVRCEHNFIHNEPVGLCPDCQNILIDKRHSAEELFKERQEKYSVSGQEKQ